MDYISSHDLRQVVMAKPDKLDLSYQKGSLEN